MKVSTELPLPVPSAFTICLRGWGPGSERWPSEAHIHKRLLTASMCPCQEPEVFRSGEND